MERSVQQPVQSASPVKGFGSLQPDILSAMCVFSGAEGLASTRDVQRS